MDALVTSVRLRGRRRFLQGSLALAGLGLLSGCGSLPWPGRQPAKVPRIGFLAVGTREGRAAARVRHENVVAVYEVGDVRGLPYIAMEYLRGTTLQDFVRTKGRPSRRHAVRICKEVLSGLHAAHDWKSPSGRPLDRQY